MAPDSHPLVAAIRAGLSAAADPARAKGAQAYMKSEMPFRGVPSPEQKRLWREVFAAHPLETRAKWQRAVLELWRTATFREERYAAVGLAQDRRYLSYRTPAVIPMLEEMIVNGAWWDYVDALASHPLGDVLVADPARVSRLMRRWARRLRRLGTLLAAMLWQAAGWSAAISPTILTWDWTAVRRILPMEARSP